MHNTQHLSSFLTFWIEIWWQIKTIHERMCFVWKYKSTICTKYKRSITSASLISFYIPSLLTQNNRPYWSQASSPQLTSNSCHLRIYSARQWRCSFIHSKYLSERLKLRAFSKDGFKIILAGFIYRNIR